MENITPEKMNELLKVAGDVNFLDGFMLGMISPQLPFFEEKFFIKALKKQLENDFREGELSRRIKMVEDRFRFTVPHNLDL